MSPLNRSIQSRLSALLLVATLLPTPGVWANHGAAISTVSHVPTPRLQQKSPAPQFMPQGQRRPLPPQARNPVFIPGLVPPQARRLPHYAAPGPFPPAGPAKSGPAPRDELAAPLSQQEANQLIHRLIDRLEASPRLQPGLGAAPGKVVYSRPGSSEMNRLRAENQQLRNEVSGVRDDLEFHLKKVREKENKPGKVEFFGAGQFSYTVTDRQADRSPLLRFPYDWDQTPNSGVIGAAGRGRRFAAVDYFKLGIAATFGSKYRLIALASSNAFGQINGSFGQPAGSPPGHTNGFELRAPTLQGEALFVDVKEAFHEQLDLKAGYFWLPWGREVEGLLRLNPHFNSNSYLYQQGFSQAENQTGLFFQTRNHSRIQYGFGLTSGDKNFLPGTAPGSVSNPGRAGQPYWSRPTIPNNSRLGRYASIQGDFNRFDWDLNYFDNGGETGSYKWKGWVGGFTWEAHRRLTLKAEIGITDVEMSTGALARWEAGYASIIWRLTSRMEGAIRLDRAQKGNRRTVDRVISGRTASLAYQLTPEQKLLLDYTNPESNPGFNPANPILSPGTDIADDIIRFSYRLVF